MRLLIGHCWLAAAVLVACPRGSDAPTGSPAAVVGAQDGPAEPDAEPPAAEPPLSVLEKIRRGETKHMDEHFRYVAQIHDAMVQGGIEQARPPASALVNDKPAMVLEEWWPYLLRMRDAADQISRAQSLDDAGRATGALARSCGDCHRAFGAHITLAASPAPSDLGTPAAIMERHKWASDRLWEALVIPSDEAWQTGVAAFVALPPCPDDVGSEFDRNQHAKLVEQVETLEKSAQQATNQQERAEVYGGLLTTCATCHLSGC